MAGGRAAQIDARRARCDLHRPRAEVRQGLHVPPHRRAPAAAARQNVVHADDANGAAVDSGSPVATAGRGALRLRPRSALRTGAPHVQRGATACATRDAAVRRRLPASACLQRALTPPCRAATPRPTRSAQMAELVDALVSGTSAARRGGSSPLLGTILVQGCVLDMRQGRRTLAHPGTPSACRDPGHRLSRGRRPPGG